MSHHRKLSFREFARHERAGIKHTFWEESSSWRGLWLVLIFWLSVSAAFAEDSVQELFREARGAHLKENVDLSAQTLERAAKAIADLPKQGDEAGNLKQVQSDLTGVASKIRHGYLGSVRHLNPLFSEVSVVLARYYQDQARRHEATDEAYFSSLDAAVNHILSGYHWLGIGVDQQTAVAIREVREIIWEQSRDSDEVTLKAARSRAEQQLTQALTAFAERVRVDGPASSINK